jgi:hypothetical protein
MKSRTLIGLGAAAIALGIGIHTFTARSEEPGGFGPPFMRHGPGSMMRHMGGVPGMETARDSATAEQLRVIHSLFANHERIKRTVTNLATGIRTVTESDDPAVAQWLKTHVADMMKRVEAGDDPRLPIESPALHAIFRDKDKVRTTVEVTAKGVAVVQTSDDSKTVAALQEHASQVTGLVEEGMGTLHAAMMRNFGGATHGRMMGFGMMHGPM